MSSTGGTWSPESNNIGDTGQVPVAPPAARWRIVVPVKGGPAAKSRLASLPSMTRTELARAMALDTLAAVCAVIDPDDVCVVAGAADARGWLAGLGMTVLDDYGGGLDAALQRGLGWADETPRARAARERPPSHVAVLLGDLPALSGAELACALDAAAAYPRAFVPDHLGEGTVLLTSDTARLMRPAFGAGSARRHEQAGHRRLDLDLPGLRTDVDDADSLSLAVSVGVGRHTAAAVLGFLATEHPPERSRAEHPKG